MTKFVFKKIGKHCRKERKCWLSASFSLATMFLKALFFWVIKIQDCLLNDKNSFQSEIKVCFVKFPVLSFCKYAVKT